MISTACVLRSVRNSKSLNMAGYPTRPMSTASWESGAVDRYREEADRFLASIDEEYYLHFAGLKDELALEELYERHGDLMTLDACRALEASIESGAATTELWRFACEGYLGNLTREDTEALAELEATLEVEVDGDTIGYRLLRSEVANEPDRERRLRLEAARAEVVEERLNPIYRRALDTIGEGIAALGAPSYRELYERFDFRLAALGESCEGLLEMTEELYVRSFDKLFRDRLGLTLDQATRPDLLRLLRGNEWDSGFPADAMLPALTGTLADLGIDLAAQPNVELDVEARPNKSPRAFCSPIEVPGRVVLVIQPMGGPDDWHALFHEAGHTEHFAHTSADLPLEARRLGDNSVTEGWAALLERLVDDPVWLERRLDFGRPARVRRRERRHPPLRAAPLRRQGALRAGAPPEPGPGGNGRPLRRAARRRDQDPSVPGRLPRRRGRRVLRLLLRPLVGVRGADPALPARAVRHRVVCAPRGRIAAP